LERLGRFRKPRRKGARASVSAIGRQLNSFQTNIGQAKQKPGPIQALRFLKATAQRQIGKLTTSLAFA